jgi:SpoVK/Ycf46/Vps4 family AAA+-type ATPase
LAPGKSVCPRGVLLLGVPGSGKSAFAKALGNETGRPTISLDMGALMGSLVGQTEERTRAALAVIDAMAPAILFIDEVEKGLAGAGTETSGVTTRMFGAFLTWLNDHTSDVFTVCTSNDIAKLPPEFTRAGRFDAVFFLDLPTNEQRETILGIHATRYQIDVTQSRPDMENWTGAEIESCCRLAALLDEPLTEAAIDVVPVAVTAADRVEGLRQWASGRVLDADRKGIYHRTRQAKEPATRRVLNRKADTE